MNKWVEELKENLKVGDMVVKNHGSFKTSMPYIVTEINENGFKARLAKNEKSINLLKMNKNYCSKHFSYDFSNAGSFAAVLKLNLGTEDTDEVRAENLNKIF